MKKIILIVSVLLATTTSFATSLAPSYLTAQLTSFEVNHDNLNPILMGSVAINYVSDQIELSLTVDQNFCPEGMVCPAVYLEPITHKIELPIISISKGWCGATVYTAELDMTPVDGLRQTLTVTDFSSLECRIFVALENMTEVQYSTFNPWAAETITSQFAGEALSGDVFFK